MLPFFPSPDGQRRRGEGVYMCLDEKKIVLRIYESMSFVFFINE
jgi:hypothetical protein